MIRRVAAFLALITMGAVDVQAATTRSYPSLAKRPAESQDRLGATPAAPAATVEAARPDTALVAQVDRLRSSAVAGDSAFHSELDKGRGSVAAAVGARPSSEAWVVAQMAISAADTARYESVSALASLDKLHIDRRDNADGARVAADMAAIDPARAQVLALVDEQNDTLDALRGRLARP